MKAIHLAFIFSVLEVSFCKFTEDILFPSDKECIKELGMEARTVLDSINEIDYTTIEGDVRINDFNECVYRKLNAIGDHNEIKYEELKSQMADFAEMLNKDIGDKIQVTSAGVDSCRTVEGTSLGDTLVKFSNCFVKYVRSV